LSHYATPPDPPIFLLLLPLADSHSHLNYLLSGCVAMYVNELLPAIWAAIAFGWSVGYTVVVPQVMEKPPYNFTNIQIGLVFMAALAGSVIGKLGGGFVSDVTVTYMTRRSRDPSIRVPEYRLYSLIWSSPLLLLGLLFFGLGFEYEKDWPMIVVGGIGIYYAALNVLTVSLFSLCLRSTLPSDLSFISNSSLSLH